MKIVSSLLVVDDNPGDIELCEHTFARTKRFPYIYSVRDGEEAVALFTNYEASQAAHPKGFPPRLILLDINMPRMDGFGFLQEFGKMRQEIVAKGHEPAVVVMITSSTDPRDRERAESLGITAGFLNKPPTVETANQLADRFGVEV